MISTARDYGWFSQRFPDLAEAYCVTLVQGLTPTELLGRLGVRDPSRVTGVEALTQPAYDAWEEYEGDELFVAVTAAGSWALAVEPNGYLGVTEEAILPLSRGTTVVSHFRNVNAADRFYWIDDEDVRLSFEPLFPTHRDGSDPDGLTEVMSRVGFDIRSDDDGNHGWHTEATFALAEYLTQVRLTPEFLESAVFQCGTARLPGR